MKYIYMENKRNKFAETDGLYYESETHEWFNDKIGTNYARKQTFSQNSKDQNDDLNLYCFVVRNKENGEYNRVVLDGDTHDIIYETKSLEDLGFFLDKLKILKRYDKQ